MATTKIWPVRDNLKRVVEYAENHLKTENPSFYTPEEMRDLFDVLEYGKNGEKTEQQFYVTGVNCADKTAYAQMMLTKHRYGKLDGNLAYHAYMSFEVDEVTPDKAHEIGVELAKRLWGDRYEIVVSTHLNTTCCHNHFVINSVSFVDGKKLNNNYAMYFEHFRKQSDKICKEYGISVIDKPSTTKTPRNIHIAEKNGEPTRYNIFREDIDKAITNSLSQRQVGQYLRNLGYDINFNENRKYWTISFKGDKRATRLERLGEQYSVNAINKRILDVYIYPKAKQPMKIKSFAFNGSFTKVKKLTGIYALYIRYCYELGILPKNTTRKPLSPEMRMEVRKMEKYSSQTRLLCYNKIVTIEELLSFLELRKNDVKSLENSRNKIYNKLRGTKDTDKITELKAKRDVISAKMKEYRRDIFLADDILKRQEQIKEQIRKNQEIKLRELGLDKPKQKTKKEMER